MVIVGIVGPQKSGKKSVAAALQKLHGFTIINIDLFGRDSSEINDKREREQPGAAPVCSSNGCSPGDEAAGQTLDGLRREAAATVMDYCERHRHLLVQQRPHL